MRRDDLPIPEPCHADWNAMEPRGNGRFCAECAKQVVDVSAMREAEARAAAPMLRRGGTCVSYVVRSDGTIRFADSPATQVPDVRIGSLVRRGRSMVAAAALTLAACHPAGEAGCDAPLAVETRTAGAPVANPIPPPPPRTPDTTHAPTPPKAPTAPTTVDPPTSMPPKTVDPPTPRPSNVVRGRVAETRVRGESRFAGSPMTE